MKTRGCWRLDAYALKDARRASRTRQVSRLRVIAALGLAWTGCDLPPHAPSQAGSRFDAGSSATQQDARVGLLDARPVAWPDSGSLDEAGSARDAPAPVWTLPWLRSEVALEPDGRSVPLSFALGFLSRPVFALRTYAADAEVSAALCFQLEEVRADAAGWWVPTATSADYGDYCIRCEQRVAVGSGYGMFVLPSAALQPESVARLELRIALRDCLTLSPLSAEMARPRSLLVESAAFSEPPRAALLELPLAIIVATPEAFSGGAELDSTFARVREIWRAAGIELLLRGPLRLPRPPSPVVYGATDRAALAALMHAAQLVAQDAGVESAAPAVVLTPCLVRQNPLVAGLSQPLAITTHVPGGFALGSEPDAVFVAAERCGGLTPSSRYQDSDSLAAVIAHELGHYLGLFHVIESDGREDTLVDTRADAPSLMQALPSPGASALTESQISIARRHPALATTSRYTARSSRR